MISRSGIDQKARRDVMIYANAGCRINFAYICAKEKNGRNKKYRLCMIEKNYRKSKENGIVRHEEERRGVI
jgi:hypothetical protein